MLKKLVPILLISSLISGCASTPKSPEAEVQEKVDQLSRKYNKFTSIGDFVNNSVAIYGCTFIPLASGGISDVKIKKLYDSVNNRYDQDVPRRLASQPGIIVLPKTGKPGKIYGKVYCFQKEKWPGTNLHVPLTFIIYDGLIHHRHMSCSKEEMLGWVQKLQK